MASASQAHDENFPFEILLVEDNPGDVLLTRTALRSARVDSTLHAVRDGASAIAYLTRRPPYAEARRPNLVLLDLNLPGMHGGEVLRTIKADAAMRDIPVIVLSTSGDRRDVASCYRDHANCYIRKPSEIGAFRDVIRKIDDFWFATAELPDG